MNLCAGSATARTWPALALPICLLFGQASAQQSQAEITLTTLEEVVVTAQKRTEDLQRVPISISVLGTEELEQRGVQNVRDLQFSVPNLTLYSQADFNPNIIVRGIQSSARNIGFESALGVYVDGVFQGRTSAATQDLDDVAQVEVLRGPQGTVFGKNTTTGAISINTLRPGDEFSTNVALEAGDLSQRRASALISGPLVEGRIGAKLSGFSVERDGFYRNVSGSGPDRLLDRDSQGVRGELRFTPTRQLDIALRGDWSQSKMAALDSETFEVLANPLGVPLDALVPGPRTVSVNGSNGNERTIAGGSATVDYELADGSAITFISAHRSLDFDVIQADIDNSSADYLAADYADELSHVSHELRFRSADTGRLRYVLGLYYFDQDSSSRRDSLLGSDLQLLFGIPPEVISHLAVGTRAAISTTSFAAFANGSFALTDRLSLVAGLRYTQEKKEISFSQSVPPLGLPYPDIASSRDELDDDDASPTLGVTYQFTDGIFGYAKYSKGFKSGGWNSELLAVDDISQVRFEPESIQNFELGVRTDLWERRMRLNLTAFNQRYEDIQISSFVGGLIGYRTTNAAQATSRGGELELQVYPLQSLLLSAGVGYADAKYDEYPNGGGPGVDLDGEPLDAPKWTIATSAQLTLPVSSSAAFVGRLDYSYRSSMPTDILDENSGVPGFGLLDARLGLRFGTSWELSLWCKNVLDKEHLLSRFTHSNLDLIGVSQLAGSYGEPRIWGLRVSYSR
jgi:iron complex outermembrane recepter protein